MCAMYNIANLTQKKRLELEPYIPGVYLWIGAKIYYNFSSYEKLANELHD